MNKIQFLNFGLPIFPQPEYNQRQGENITSILKEQTKVDKRQQDTTPVNNNSTASIGQLPTFTSTEYNNVDQIQIPSRTINRNLLVSDSIQSGRISKDLQNYTKQYGIYNPAMLGVVSISKPSIPTSSNRTDILYNKTLGKLFDRSVLPDSNIVI